MSLPKAVQQQVKRAEEISARIHQKKEAPPPEEEEVQAEAAEESAPSEQPPPKAEWKPNSPEAPDEETWVRFKNYKASTDETIVSQRRQIAEQQSQIDGLKYELDSLKRELSKPRPETVAQTKTPPKLNEKFKDLFNDDEQAAILEMAQFIAAQQTQGLQQKLSSFEQERARMTRAEQQKQQVDYRSKFEQLLDDKAPDWRQADTDPQFIEFLKQPDPDSIGKARNDLFRAAYHAGDVAGVAKHYLAFLGNGAVAPTQARTMPERRSPSSSSPAPKKQKHIWRPGEFQEMVQMKLRGKIKPEEFARREADYYAAMREGRVARR